MDLKFIMYLTINTSSVALARDLLSENCSGNDFIFAFEERPHERERSITPSLYAIEDTFRG